MKNQICNSTSSYRTQLCGGNVFAGRERETEERAPKPTASSVADFDGLSSAFAGRASSLDAATTAAATSVLSVLGALLASSSTSALGNGH